MKKYLVIGNPIDHSLSPKLHNYWIKKNKINAIYEKQKLENSDLEDLLFQVKEKKILTELENSKKLFKKYNWPVIDVTRKSVEETAASIIKILDILNSR